MIWLMWRQHRLAMLISTICLAFACFILVRTGLSIADTYQSSGLATCLAQHLACSDAHMTFRDFFDRDIAPAVSWLYVLPLLVGMFVGAPLVASEREQRTHLLIWTQSITRWRWLMVKLGVLVGATLLVFAALTALMAWWSEPVNAALGLWTTYDWQGMVPLAYAFFALALGITVGTLTGRNVAAIALTLVGFVALRLAVESWLRPHFLPPLSYSWPYGQPDPRPFVGNLDIYQGLGAPAGQSVPHISQLCGGSNSNIIISIGRNVAFDQCMHTHGIFFSSIYQPGNRFWLFQGIESAIFLVLAVALLGLTIWWVRRRLS